MPLFSEEEKKEIITKEYYYKQLEKQANRIIAEYKEPYKDESCLPEPSEKTCLAYNIINLLKEIEKQQKQIENSVSKDIIKKETKKLKECMDDALDNDNWRAYEGYGFAYKKISKLLEE